MRDEQQTKGQTMTASQGHKAIIKLLSQNDKININQIMEIMNKVYKSEGV